MFQIVMTRIQWTISIMLLTLFHYSKAYTANKHTKINNEITVPDDNAKLVVSEHENYLHKKYNGKERTQKRLGKILWPYPVGYKGNLTKDDGLEEINKTKDEKPEVIEVTSQSVQDVKDIENQEVNKYETGPITSEEVVKKNGTNAIFEKVKKDREARFLLWSYPQSQLLENVMQSAAVNFSPQNDPFDFLRDSYPLPKGYTAPLDEYDYVIVGAGSAGSVLASRLSEGKPRAMVLVLEAGKPECLLTDIPALVPFLQLTDYSWPYKAEKQPGVCLGSEMGRCFLPRGKAVGGSSVTNYMVYSRGRRVDWDRIAADGNYGWSYDDVLPYFLKSEKESLKREKNPQYHSKEGKLSVQNLPFRTGLIEAFLEAGRKTGSPTIDYNQPDGMGFGYVQTTTENGHRFSAAKAFLHPHKRRRNLHILPESRATKVLIEPQTKRAYGVEYVRFGKTHKVRARREVILSAGPIASPQLLMLSGVGPQDHLNSLGIPVLKNLPVGRTLYDHVAFLGAIFKLNTTNASLLEPRVGTMANLAEWMQYGEGLLTSSQGIEGIGFIKTSESEDKADSPDIELISVAGSLNFDSGTTLIKSWGISQETYHHSLRSLNGLDTWTAVPVLLHPKSKGYMELRNTNPLSHPKLYMNHLTHPKDLATLRASIKEIIKLVETDAFNKYSPKIHLGHYESCRSLAPGSDDYWDCAIRTLMVPWNHQIGTSKMGPPGDPDAVVDPELRVYGVNGLRVVDSGVIPRTLAAHTNAPAIMIGEKAADLIKRTWANVV